jgi:hypothetical protein
LLWIGNLEWCEPRTDSNNLTNESMLLDRLLMSSQVFIKYLFFPQDKMVAVELVILLEHINCVDDSNARSYISYKCGDGR